MKKDNKFNIDRRTFLRLGSAGAASLAGLTALPAIAETANNKLKFRTLGRTGMKVTTIGFGAMRTSEPAVFRAAFNMGINYIDTARGYMGGRNEQLVGEALKGGNREKVYVASKTAPGSFDDMMNNMNASLEALDIEYVDIIQLHAVGSPDQFLNDEARRFCDAVKKEGKAKFVGVTTHTNMADVLNALADDPEQTYDTVLVTYNFESDADIKQAIARVAAKDIGVIAMKTQAGGYETDTFGDATPHQAALRYVLADTNVALAVPAMVNLNELREDFAVMEQMHLTTADIRSLEKYRTATASVFCSMCGKCKNTCQQGIDVPAVNRCLMYAEGYRDLDLARTTYAELPKACSAEACAECSTCTVNCVRGLNIADKMRRARTVLT